VKILGIDYGDRKIGLAFGDMDIKVAVPLEVIQNTGETTILFIKSEIEENDIGVVVVGVPLSTGQHHGSEQLDKTKVFIEKLKKAVDPIPVEVEDEAFTTVASIDLQKEKGVKAEEDALAAMLIVRQYMDR